MQEPPGQTFRRGSRRALDAQWLDYLSRQPSPFDAQPLPPLDDAIAAFNQTRFFESHEAFEHAWNNAGYPARLFCLGLVKVATGFAHAQRGNRAGALRLLRDGLRLLGPFIPVAWGVDTHALMRDVDAWIEARRPDGSPYPRIRRAAAPSPSQTPKA